MHKHWEDQSISKTIKLKAESPATVAQFSHEQDINRSRKTSNSHNGIKCGE